MYRQKTPILNLDRYLFYLLRTKHRILALVGKSKILQMNVVPSLSNVQTSFPWHKDTFFLQKNLLQTISLSLINQLIHY